MPRRPRSRSTPLSAAARRRSRRTRRVSSNVVGRTGYRRGDVDAALAASDVVVEGRFTTSWVHQGYIEPQVATGRARPRRRPPPDERDAGHVLDPLGAVAPVRAADRPRPRDRRDARWRVRREAARRRSARRRGDARAAPPGAGRADPPRGLPDEQPGPGRDRRADRRRDARRPADRTPGAPAVRDRRLLRGQHRGHRGDPDDRPVPLGGPRGRRLRRRDQPGRDGRLPRPRRAAGDVRARAGHRRAGRPSRHRPDRAPPPEPGRSRRRDGRRDGVGRHRPRRVPRPARGASDLAGPRVAARRRGRRAGRRCVARQPPAGLGDLPARGGRPDHRRHRRRGHVRADHRVRDARRRGPRPGGRRRLGHVRRHRVRAALAGERRERHHLFDRSRDRARDGPAPREDPRVRRARARDRRPRPRARRRRRPAARDPRSRDDAGRDRPQARRLLRRVRAARGPRRLGPAEPRAADLGPPRPRPGRSRDGRGRGPRLRHRPGRRSGDQSGHHRGPAPRRARRRGSAGRCARRWSTTRPASS